MEDIYKGIRIIGINTSLETQELKKINDEIFGWFSCI